MEPTRSERFAHRIMRPEEMTARERAIEALVQKSCVSPALLEPADLAPLIELLELGGALEIVSMLGSFHYITRMTDLVGIQAWLDPLRKRPRWILALARRLQATLARWGMDFSNQVVEIDVAAELSEIERLRGEPLPAGYEAMFEAPVLAAYTRAMMSGLPTLDPDMLDQVTRTVAACLPSHEAEATDELPLPLEPLDALAFVGTHFAHRTTTDLDAVRRRYAWSDAELSDVFYAIATRNTLERFDRLLIAPSP